MQAEFVHVFTLTTRYFHIKMNAEQEQEMLYENNLSNKITIFIDGHMSNRRKSWQTFIFVLWRV